MSCKIRIARFVAAAGSIALLPLLQGCGAFFVCDKASCPSTSSTTVTGTNFAYVSNSTTGSTYINGYSLQSGTLNIPTTGSPYSLGFTPDAMAINPANTLLFVSSTSGGVSVYSIAADGALTLLNGGPVTSILTDSIAFSPDGNYIFFLDETTTTTATLDEDKIASSTGTLTNGTPIDLSQYVTAGTTFSPVEVSVSPSASFVVVTMGGAGDVVFPYDEGTGMLSPASITVPTSLADGFFGLAIDGNDYLYVGSTDGLLDFDVNAGVPSPVNSTPYTLGARPESAVVSANNDYVYIANAGPATISQYMLTSGAATSLGAAVTAPSGVASIGRDNSGDYILAAGYSGTNGLMLYTIGSNGPLSTTAMTATGTTTTVPSVIALTH